jgi:GxxExxY protein
MSTPENLSYQVIGCIIEVYKTLGPGLLESIYEKALIHELELKGISVATQVEVNINYKGVDISNGLRLDLLVNDSIIIELKSVEEVKAVHYKQLLSYLRLTNKQVGLLVNFNVDDIMSGIKRVVNNYHP